MIPERYDSLLPRFDVPKKIELIANVFRAQSLISGDAAIASELAQVTILRELTAGETLISQGEAVRWTPSVGQPGRES
jgi:hypothetical protein